EGPRGDGSAPLRRDSHISYRRRRNAGAGGGFRREWARVTAKVRRHVSHEHPLRNRWVVVGKVRQGKTRWPIRAATGWLRWCALFALAGAQSAMAHPRAGVTFQRRSYDVRIARNGDVTVRERWDTTFSGGPFDSATLGVYLAHTTGVDFSAVEGATPGSEKVSDVDDKAGSRIRQLTWNFPAAHDESRTFTIPYTIHGAMAQNSSKVWLDWHFLDGAGRSAIEANAVTISITPPAALAVTDVQAQAVYPGATLKPTMGTGGA